MGLKMHMEGCYELLVMTMLMLGEFARQITGMMVIYQ
jgi:hypothetical protein